MNIHELKIYPDHLDAIIRNEKRAELRKDDRNFQAGDILCLREIKPVTGAMSGRWVVVQVTHILSRAGGQYYDTLGLEPNYVVLSFNPIWGLDGSAFYEPREVDR